MIRFSIPIKTRNPLNGAQGRTRGAVFAKAARRKKERNDSRLAAQAAGLGTLLTLPVVATAPINGLPTALVIQAVTLTRLAAGTMDGDGLQASLKSCRDGIADALGINDGSDVVTWKYEQKKCKRGGFGVEVTIE